MAPDLLGIEGLRTYFFVRSGPIKAVDDVTLELEKGETLGLLGESGCGKTTIGLSILRLVPPPGRIVQGRILLEDRNLLDMGEEEMRRTRGSKISCIFQDPVASLDPVCSIEGQMVEAISHDIGSERKERMVEKAVETLSRVGIPDPRRLMRMYPHELSGGMAQRVMIAIALLHNPLLLIADEPTSLLDATIQAQVLRLLKEINRNNGVTILLITHNFGVVTEICDRVAILYSGAIAEYGSVADVWESPMHPYTKGLLRVIPKLGEDPKSRFEVIPGSVPSASPSGCRFFSRCPQAMQLCKDEKPSRQDVSNGHVVYCHLYD